MDTQFRCSLLNPDFAHIPLAQPAELDRMLTSSASSYEGLKLKDLYEAGVLVITFSKFL